MATAEECREALQTLTGRLAEMDPQDRSSFFSNRTFSCYVTDLGITFVTRITANGAEPVKEAGPDEPPADIRITASSDDTVALAATPAQHRPHVDVRAGQDPGQPARPAGPAPAAVVMGDLILLRHGETEWSLAGRHTGRTDIPLTPRGEAAAAALAPMLAKRHIVAAFASPAQRAARTAVLAGLAGATPDPDLWEWDYGGYEGLTTAQIQEQRPGWSLWRDGVIPGDAAHPGETVEQVGARVDRVLARVAPLLAGGDVALVAHGHVLRVLTARYLRLPPDDGRLFRLDTGTVSTLGHRARRAGHPVLERAAQSLTF